EQLLDPVEEHAAARLADVEQRHALADEAVGPLRALARRTGLTLRRRIEQRLAHVRTSRVTGSLPTAPLAQPPMMAENSPALPPAWVISRPPGRNFGRVVPGGHNASGMPSAMPPAPRTISSAGSRSSASSSSRRRDLVQP